MPRKNIWDNPFFMNLKKGQITIFIVLGMVLTISFLLLYFLSSTESAPTVKNLNFDSASIESYVIECLSSASSESLILLGKQGGYIHPSIYLELEGYNVAYLLFEGNNKLPGEAEVISQLSVYIKERLSACVTSLAEESKWESEIGEKQVNVVLGSGSVGITLTMPVRLKNGDQEIILDTFAVRKEADLPSMFNSISEIISSVSTHDGGIDMMMLSGMPYEFEIFTAKGETFISVTDISSNVDGKPYQFIVLLDT